MMMSCTTTMSPPPAASRRHLIRTRRQCTTNRSSSSCCSNINCVRTSTVDVVRLLAAVVVAVVSLSSTMSTVGAISLLNGRYETVTDVSDYLNLALDAAAMKEATDVLTKKDIYVNGSSTASLAEGGTTVTLQSLSTTAQSYMSENPYYHLFRHAFLVLGNTNEGEASGMFDGAPIEVYGDTIVGDLFDLNIDDIEAEAAIVMNVWMACVNYVWEALTQCRGQNKETAMLALDKAAALWVGEGQVEGSNDEGYLLYHIAQNAGERFNQDVGEVEVNSKVIGLFIEMQTMLLADQCSTVNGYESMRQDVKRLVGIMTVPLVQNLIHHTMNVENESGSYFVELYALSVIPRVAACDPEAYDTALHLDVLRSLPASKKEESIGAIQRAYSCLDITCADVGSYLGGQLPECNDATEITRGGYTAGQTARSKSYIDRDILQIDIFMKFQAYGTALDWYTHGWNSVYSLRQLAKNEVVPTLQSEESLYLTYSRYYQDEVFAHTMIQNVIELIPPYNEASREQVRNSATGFLKYVLMHVAAVDHLRYAVEECRNGNSASSVDYVDVAAMLFVGSMEGSADGGNSYGGELLFTTAKELCADFGTCVSKGDVTSAAVNDIVLSSLLDVKGNIDVQNCDAAGNTIQTTIVPAMSVPLIQGTLKYASYNDDLSTGTTDASLSIGDAFLRGILPLVDKVSSTSAQTLRSEMQFQLNSSPVSGGFSAVAAALREVLSGIGVDCGQVGVLVVEPTLASLCGEESPMGTGPPSGPAPAPVPVPEGPAGLAFGRYLFDDVNVADTDGSFALDVKEMFQAESTSAATSIYTDGLNVLGGLSGEASISSLGAMSTRGSQFMSDDLMFNTYKYALYDDADLGNLNEEFLYADDVIVEALSNSSDQRLAAEATVILNVWMMIAHRLYTAIRSCDGGGSPTSLIDSSVALWIGHEQVEGKFDNGWMLYSIGQSSLKFFGFAEAEAPANTKLMTLFIEAQSVSRSCPDTPNAPSLLRALVYEIIRTLTRPLIMSMLFHMVKDSKNMVELYAVAVIPQCAACNTQAHLALQDALFSGYNKDTSLNDGLYDNLAIFLRCQRITCEDIRTEVDADDLLKDLVENLCERLDYDLESFLPMAGYIPQTSVVETSRLDLDALEMYIMMRTQAYTTALDIYEHGHNSVGSSAFFGAEVGPTDQLTLKQLATNFERETVSQYKEYKNYFGSNNYADEIIRQAIRRTGDYASATREAASVIVKRTIQTMISFMGALLKMQSAIDKCNSGSADGARAEWDRAAALYIGFSQGILAGADSSGEFMYSLSNEVCNDFGVCENSGEATVNQQLIKHFAGGRDSLIDGECDHIEKTVADEIVPRMTIPLVQATIVFSIQANSLADAESSASLHIMSQAVAPLVQRQSTSDAGVLREAYGNFQSLATTTPTSKIVSALVGTIQSTGIGCDEVGSPSDYTLCSGGPTGDIPLEETPTSLAQGSYETTTYVKDHADIAKDIVDISQALLEKNLELAKIVYKTGKNSQIFDKEGMFVGLRKLQGFSTESTNDMLDEPEFNIFMFALNNNREYANDLVEKAFDQFDSANPASPAEAAIVLNLWMEIVHQLHKTVQACNLNQLRDEDGVHGMDIAVAYWIGDGQLAGDADNGHLLYALAEKFGELFNIDDGGQSKTNTNILRLFNEAKNEVALPNACSDNRTTFTRLRRIVNQLVSQMSIPLVQGLIHYLRTNDRERVRIYATAFVPLVAGCSPGLFAYLQEKLLGMTYNVVEVEEVIQKIRQSYPCLGLECADIGVHISEETDENTLCNDPDVYEPLAGYRPSSDVREYARLDLDIREIDVLMQMKAYSAALDLYTYGKHVKGANRGSRSLSQIATTSQRSIVPEYDAFVRYYTNDGYADQLIRTALDTSLTSFSNEQRRTIVVKACQVLVVYLSALQSAYNAESECTSSSSQFRTIGNTETWDKVAAELIGHLEGPDQNGSTEGYMVYDLAQEHCLEFGTCEKNTVGVTINDELISLLYTGRGAVIDNSCQVIRKAADELSSLLLIPIIQGALSSAIGLSRGEDEKLRAAGYVYGRALLPLVRKRKAADTLEEYLGRTRPKHSRRTASEVFGALATAYSDMGVDCSMIGEAAGNNPCDGVVYGTPDYVWIILGVFGGFLVFGCIGYFYCRRRRNTFSLPENNPKFIHSDGELNHSMDLLEKAFSSTARLQNSPLTDRDGTARSISPESEREALSAFHDASPVDDEDFESISSLRARLTADADII